MNPRTHALSSERLYWDRGALSGWQRAHSAILNQLTQALRTTKFSAVVVVAEVSAILSLG